MKLELTFKKGVGVTQKELPEWYIGVNASKQGLDDGFNILEREDVLIDGGNFDYIQAALQSIGWFETQNSVSMRSNDLAQNAYLQLGSIDFKDKDASIQLIQSTFEILTVQCFADKEQPFDRNDLQIAVHNLINEQRFQYSAFSLN
jgi:hypothetical protein